MSLVLQDLLIRLQLTGQKYSELTNTFVNDLKWGKKCAKTEWKNLIILDVYISLLEDYNIDGVNCITEDQLITVFDNISTLTKLCFKPFNYTYSQDNINRQFDDSFSDSFY